MFSSLRAYLSGGARDERDVNGNTSPKGSIPAILGAFAASGSDEAGLMRGVASERARRPSGSGFSGTRHIHADWLGDRGSLQHDLVMALLRLEEQGSYGPNSAPVRQLAIERLTEIGDDLVDPSKWPGGEEFHRLAQGLRRVLQKAFDIGIDRGVPRAWINVFGGIEGQEEAIGKAYRVPLIDFSVRSIYSLERFPDSPLLARTDGLEVGILREDLDNVRRYTRRVRALLDKPELVGMSRFHTYDSDRLYEERDHLPMLPLLDSSPCAPHIDHLTVRLRTVAEVDELARCRNLHPRHLVLFVEGDALSQGGRLVQADWIRELHTIRIKPLSGLGAVEGVGNFARELFAEASWPRLRAIDIAHGRRFQTGWNHEDRCLEAIAFANGLPALTELHLARTPFTEPSVERRYIEALMAKMPAGSLADFGRQYVANVPGFDAHFERRAWWNERPYGSVKMRQGWEETDEWR